MRPAADRKDAHDVDLQGDNGACGEAHSDIKREARPSSKSGSVCASRAPAIGTLLASFIASRSGRSGLIRQALAQGALGAEETLVETGRLLLCVPTICSPSSLV